MPIAELLISQRQWGRGRCHRFLLGVTMDESKPIGSMTERQRIAVAALLTAGLVGSPPPAKSGDVGAV
jgi:hypothetical protein